MTVLAHVRSRPRGAASLCVGMGVIAVLIAAQVVGSAGRRLATQTSVVNVSSPGRSIELWRDAGVHGRRLLLFDRRLNAEGDGRSNADDAYVLTAMKSGLVRRVTHVIPDRAWPEVEAFLEDVPAAAKTSAGFRLTSDGTPIEVVRLDGISETDEPWLIAINGEHWGAEAHLITDRLRALGATADLIALSGTPGARGQLEELLAPAE